jgi:2-oxoacid:acceptor oxidoreductase gamma subunit (pyruvate/2-ketoisovalerate family)
MLEIRFHGRGGQGAVTTAELVAQAAVSEGRYCQAFPSFGPERRGAPVMAFCRVDDARIRVRAQVKFPDAAVVLDPKLMDVVDATAGMKPGGVLVLNSHESADELRRKYNLKCRLALVNASKIAIEELKRPITNTAMLGALIKASGVVKLESLETPIKERFGKIADINWKAVKRAYDETVIG